VLISNNQTTSQMLAYWFGEVNTTKKIEAPADPGACKRAKRRAHSQRTDPRDFFNGNLLAMSKLTCLISFCS
jgi:hypothetical protein